MANTNTSTSLLNTQPTQYKDTAIDKNKLIQQYPHLLIVDEKKKYTSSLTTAASNIRIELKKAFPNSKFSVTTKRYASGDNISVWWTDGIAYRKVEHIIVRYMVCDFYGSPDIYAYNHKLFTGTFGTAMYIYARRNITPLLYSKAAQLLGFTTPGTHMASECLDDITFKQTEDVHWKTKEIDFLDNNQKNGEI